MEFQKSTVAHWQLFWNTLEKGRNLARRRIGFERAQFILQHLDGDQLRGARIFDLGCGYAEVSRHLLAEIPQSTLIGFDWSADAINVAQKGTVAFAERAHFVKENCCEDLSFFKKYELSSDLVLSLGVIEHFPDPAKIVNGIAQVLDSDGILVLMTPNRRSTAALSRKIKQLLGIWTFGYQKEYSTDTLERWCIAAGLHVLSKHTLLRQESPVDDRLLKFFSMIDRWLSLMVPNWGFYSYVFAKKGGRHA